MQRIALAISTVAALVAALSVGLAVHGGHPRRLARADAAWASPTPPAAGTEASGSRTLPDLGPAPELRGIDAWVNGGPLELASLRGHVVLLEFWNLGCVNCIRALPHVADWTRRYADDGLVVIGVHSPEAPDQADSERLVQAVDRFEIEYPVAADNRLETWRAYRNRYWPAFYFIDARGHVRHAHFGAGSYEDSESVIRRLLAERTRVAMR